MPSFLPSSFFSLPLFFFTHYVDSLPIHKLFSKRKMWYPCSSFLRIRSCCNSKNSNSLFVSSFFRCHYYNLDFCYGCVVTFFLFYWFNLFSSLSWNILLIFIGMLKKL